MNILKEFKSKTEWQKIDTPCYIYNEEILSSSINRFAYIQYENKKIYAATMANNNQTILKLIRNLGVNVFVNSELHFDKVLNCGFKGNEIIYTSTAINEKLLKRLIKEEVIINIDSLTQLELYGTLNPGSKVGIRLNVAEFFLGNISDSVNNRIGINEFEFKIVNEITEKYNLTINGLHVYLGTDIIDFDYMKKSIIRTISIAKKLNQLEYLDFGGGFPVQGMYGEYFDYKVYDEFITNQMNELSDFYNRSIQLIIEPGRSLFGESAIFLTKVLDIKERDDRYIICSDASVSIFPRSLFYDEYHEVVSLNENNEQFDKKIDIVGHTTYSKDYLAKDLLNFPKHKVGDVLCFNHAGSYCFSMLTQFLGQKAPKELIIDKGNALKNISDNLQII